MIIKSYAKVNLYLEVIRKRRDKYHDIETVFERIDLHDDITLTPLPGQRIEIVAPALGLPKDSSNFAYKAAELLQKKYKVKSGVRIKIDKRIPIGSGLGGGSSNAAAVLLGLNKMWRLNLPISRLARLASCLGSDMAFFVYQCRFARGQGRGEKISPIRSVDKKRLWHVLVVPKIHVSTPAIYAQWDVFSNLTIPRFGVKLLLLALKSQRDKTLKGCLFNSLEPVTIALYPQVQAVRDALASLGVEAILMSGSGPAVFGVVPSRKEAVAVCRKLQRAHNSWTVVVTRTK
jgi:4-diphosphocytidyl-2-C-methyl-D-erythritol kinase